MSYYFVAIGPGRVKLANEEIPRNLNPGDCLTVEEVDARDLKENCSSWLSFSGMDKLELAVEEPNLAKELEASKAANEASLPKVPKEVDADPEVELDLAPNARVPVATDYMLSLVTLDPMPMAKIKEVAKRYPTTTRIQNLYKEALEKLEAKETAE